MDFPIIINLASPLSFFGGVRSDFNFFISFFDIITFSILLNSLRWDATFCGVTSGTMLFAYMYVPGLNELIICTR